MISVIIPTLDSERPLARTLAALVPGAVDGLVSEAIVADGGSRDGTPIVADAAGCTFIRIDEPLGRRLQVAADKARAPFLLFVRPGLVLSAGWVEEARQFTERPSAARCAAVFRRGAPAQTTLRELWTLLAGALGALPRPDQGLLIARQFYDALGGHAEHAAEPEAELLRRIGRRRLVTLVAAAEILD
jgi:glycosyltransferase involved in cell wall biosynthesis